MKNRLIIFSANYNAPGKMDPFRLSLFQSLQAQNIEVLVVQITDFFLDRVQSSLLHGSVRTVLEKLKSFDPDAVLFINPSGRIPIVQEWIQKKGIPSLTWFWDHPGIFSDTLLLDHANHAYASTNETFTQWIQNRLKPERVESIPFPSFEIPSQIPLTEEVWKTRSIPLLFMGTLWDPSLLPEAVYHFFKKKSDWETQKKLLRKIEADSEAMNKGLESPLSEQFPEEIDFKKNWKHEYDYIGFVNNHFSGKDRLRYLRELLDLGLVLYGPVQSWSSIIEGYLPEFDSVYQNAFISDPDELFRICADSKVGLNIFHRQNQGGGTNFRFNEYAVSQTPILSNLNLECEKIFPDEVGALYFSNTTEMREQAKRLLEDPSLAVKLAGNAKKISLDYFHVDRVCKSLLKTLELSGSPLSHKAAVQETPIFSYQSMVQSGHTSKLAFVLNPFIRMYDFYLGHGLVTTVMRCFTSLATKLKHVVTNLELASERRFQSKKDLQRQKRLPPPLGSLDLKQSTS